jgi:hypothetical protein
MKEEINKSRWRLPMNRTAKFSGLLLGALLLTLLVGCSEDESAVEVACVYETRHSGCNNGNYTSWETECIDFSSDTLIEGLSPSDACFNFARNDVECGGSCCISVEYRNVQANPGRCP